MLLELVYWGHVFLFSMLHTFIMFRNVSEVFVPVSVNA